MASFSAGANSFLSSPLKITSIGPNISTQRGAASVLNVHPKESKVIYPSGKFIVVRDLDSPDSCFIYRGHAHQTTVAKFSPNGFWVCSADVSGKVKVWSWDHPEHLTKLETQVFSGPVYDLDWDAESKKIVAVGDGAGISAKCFMWDTGNSVGEMVGHNKRILSVAYKPSRPYRIMTGSEDQRTIFYAGPPFKLDHSNNGSHTNFVNCVRYDPSGAVVASVGSDKKIQFYDGATGLPTGDIPNAHMGSIFSCSFSPDGKKLATASADKLLKVWDVESKQCETSFHFSDDSQVGDMQVGVLWTSRGIISASLNGDLNILMHDSPTPVKVIQGHQVAITAMCLDKASSVLYSGSFDGVVLTRNLKSVDGNASKIVTDKKSIACSAHGGKVVGLAMSHGVLWSAGWDDRLRHLDGPSGRCISDVGLLGQPVCLASSANLVAVATANAVQLFSGTTVSATLANLAFGLTSIALLNDEELAIGGDDSKVHIFSIVGSQITPLHTLDSRHHVSALAYSPDGQTLAVGDAGRLVNCYQRGGTWASLVSGLWVYHTSRITSLAWSPSGDYLCSGALDENLIVWNFRSPSSKLQIPYAHMGGVTAVEWVDENTLVSSGSDQTIVTWNVSSK